MGTGNLCFHIACFQLNALSKVLVSKLPDVCPCQPLTSGSAFCAAHMQVALEKGCPTSVKGFLKFCGASKETGSVVYFCFSDVLVSQLLLLGLNLVIFVLLMYIMCYPLQLSLFVHVLLSRSLLHHA